MFESCSLLETITIPNSVTAIGERAFYSCNSLETVVLSENLETISKSAFASCWKLKNIILPDSVSYIGSNAFYDCRSLKSIEIPSKVTTLRGCTFAQCYNLKNVKLSEGLLYMEKCVFYEGLENIQIPNSVLEIGKQFGSDYPSFLDDSAVSIPHAKDHITFPASLTKIDSIGSRHINDLYHYVSGLYLNFLSVEPPVLGSSSYGFADYKAIFVPPESVEAYKSSENWSTYAEKIFPCPNWIESI